MNAYYDNAPAHATLSICQFLTERTLQLLNTPHISPIWPRDFFLFPKIKSILKGTHFSDINSIKMAAMMELKKIPENVFP